MHPDSSSLPVLVFAKPPRPGLAKTRLAPRLGDRGAAELAAAFFRDAWSLVAGRRWARALLLTTEPRAPEWRGLPPRRIRAQGDGDLGARLERALGAELAAGQPAAIAIGTDSPGLPPEALDRARDALRDSDAVLGPSTDGGFYLLALRRCPRGLLADLPWSSDETLGCTLARLAEHGLLVRLLPPWFDVDRPEDLESLARRLLRGEIAAPETARVLGRLVSTPPRISVVVPVLDEERRIGEQLARLAGGGWHEVIVVDGGSRDRTLERARDAGATVLAAPRGRALQMNRGARAARGDVVLFLHADVELPADAPARIAAALDDPAVVGGAFRTWTQPDGGRRWWSPLLHLADLRSRYSSLPYGDQALFVRAGVFARLGGFPPLPLMEDLAFSRRLRRVGRLRTLRARVRVSGRRFQSRPIYYFLLVNLLPLLFALGVPPARLARLYGAPR